MIGGNAGRAPRTVLAATFVNNSSRPVDVHVEYELPGNSGEFTSHKLPAISPGASAHVPAKSYNKSKGKVIEENESGGDDLIFSAPVRRVVVTEAGLGTSDDKGATGLHRKLAPGTRTSIAAPFPGVSSPTKTYTFVYSDDGTLRGQQ